MTSLLKKKPLDSPDKLTHDWYSNDSWPIYHRQLTDIPPTVDRYITDIWPIVGRGASRPIVYPTLDWLSTDYRPLYRPSVDRLSTAISTDRSVDTTYSKQDPKNVQNSVKHVQSCCFANLNLLLFFFCHSRSRHSRRCLSSPMFDRRLPLDLYLTALLKILKKIMSFS